MTGEGQFLCRCSPESVAEADAVLAEVKAELEATDANLLSKVVYALWARLKDAHASIEEIVCDQWAGVIAVGWRDGERADGPNAFRTYIQCDDVEDGVAATWLAMRNHFGLAV